MFITPSRFLNDPKGYLKNQLGHLFLGYVFSFFAPNIFLVWFIYWFVIEVPQIYFSDKDWVLLDSIEDSLYVLCGAIANLLSLLVLPFVALILLYGAYQRHAA